MNTPRKHFDEGYDAAINAAIKAFGEADGPKRAMLDKIRPTSVTSQSYFEGWAAGMDHVRTFWDQYMEDYG